MILTWRAGALAAAAVLAVAIVGSWWALLIASGVLVALIVLDLALGASPAKVRVRRDGDTSVRLGEQAHTELLLTNTGRRDLTATVRDAWTPSAGAHRRGAAGADPGPAAAPARADAAADPPG